MLSPIEYLFFMELGEFPPSQTINKADPTRKKSKATVNKPTKRRPERKLQKKLGRQKKRARRNKRGY